MTERDMLVSVVTVSYNSEDTVARTIDSVKAQTYPHIEYVVIDGGSTDRTVDIIKANDAFIHKWRSEPDAGIYDAMNKGIRICRGEIIGLVNSDDWYESDAVETAVNVFRQHDEADLVHGDMNLWTSEGELDTRYTSRPTLCPEFIAPFNHPACFVRRSVYEELGCFDQRFRTAADYDFMLRFVLSERTDVYVDKVLTNFTRGGATTSSFVSPYGQLWNILRKNGLSRPRSLQAVLFRLARDGLSWLANRAACTGLRRLMRQLVTYQEHDTGEDGREGIS